MNSEAERTKTKAQGPVPLEPASKDVSLTSSPTQPCTKAASKRQRGSDDAALWQPPSSKFRGVTKHRRSGRWEAHIWLGKGTNKQIYLGGYEGEEVAAEAYDVASIKAKGWSAVTNFSKERYMGLQEVIDRCTMDELIAAVKRGSQAFARGFSSYRGVSRHSGRYEARLGIAGRKYMYIGVFEEEVDAAKAYDQCAVRLKGRQAATNFLVANYVRQLAEHELKQLEMQKPEVFHALRCHACAEHALTELRDPELPTADPLCTSENKPHGPAAVFPCNAETPEGLPHFRLAEVVFAAAKEFSAVASGVPGMHTPAAVMPPFPTPEEIEIPDSHCSTWGVSEGSLQHWLKHGYPDKEFHALDRVLSRIKAQQDQSSDDKAKKSTQDGMATGVCSKNPELHEIAAQCLDSIEEKVVAIATHAAAQAIRTHASLILQNDVFKTNGCRTLMNQEVLNPPSQVKPSAQVHTSNESPHEKRARRVNPMRRSEISRAFDPSRFPASALGAHIGSGFATPAASPGQKPVYKPMRKAMSTGVQLPMPRHASAGFPCVVTSSPPVDTSAEVSAGVRSAAHACTVPQLPTDDSLCPSQHVGDTVGRHASLDTGSHTDAASTGCHAYNSCMPPLQGLQTEAEITTPLVYQQQQLPQQQLPQQQLPQQQLPQQPPHMMLPIYPMLPTAPAVPASSWMWQQPPSLLPAFIPTLPPTVTNTFYLWPQATSAPGSASASVPASHP